MAERRAHVKAGADVADDVEVDVQRRFGEHGEVGASLDRAVVALVAEGLEQRSARAGGRVGGVVGEDGGVGVTRGGLRREPAAVPQVVAHGPAAGRGPGARLDPGAGLLQVQAHQ